MAVKARLCHTNLDVGKGLYTETKPTQNYSERGLRHDKKPSRNRTTMSLASSPILDHRLPKNQKAVNISKDVFTCWDKKWEVIGVLANPWLLIVVFQI